MMACMISGIDLAGLCQFLSQPVGQGGISVGIIAITLIAIAIIANEVGRR